MSVTATTPAASSGPSQGMASDDHRHAWVTVPPIVYIGVGLLVGFFWLWGNLVQIQTSEAWILQHAYSVSLVPHFNLFLQIGAFWSGNLSSTQMVSYTWGWGIQIVLFVCSIGIERPQLFIHRRYNKGVSMSQSVAKSAELRGRIFGSASILLIILNSIADFNFSSGLGMWGQLAFSGITLIMSFFFGLIAFHLILAGVSGARH